MSAGESASPPPDSLASSPSVNRAERELKEILSLSVAPLCNSQEMNIKQKADWLCVCARARVFPDPVQTLKTPPSEIVISQDPRKCHINMQCLVEREIVLGGSTAGSSL